GLLRIDEGASGCGTAEQGGVAEGAEVVGAAANRKLRTRPTRTRHGAERRRGNPDGGSAGSAGPLGHERRRRILRGQGRVPVWPGSSLSDAVNYGEFGRHIGS